MKTLFILLATLALVGYLAIKYTPLGLILPYFVNSDKQLKGSIEFFTLGEIKYYLYLPEGYHQNQNSDYPFILHLHGAMPTGEGLGKRIIKADITNSASLLERLVDEGKAEPTIIVAPYDGNGTTMWTDSWSGENKAETNTVAVLIPFLQEHYRLSKARENWTIQGFSMGGYGAVRLGFKYADRFGKVISWDGALHNWKSLSTRRKFIANAVFKTEAIYDNDSPWELSKAYQEKQVLFPLDIYIIEGALREYNQRLQRHLEDLDLDFNYITTTCGHDFFCMLAKEETAQAYRIKELKN